MQYPIASNTLTQPTQPAMQAQMQAMQAQMMAMQQYIASMQSQVATQVATSAPAAPAVAAKKARKPRTPKDPNAPKQPIPEGTSAWISYVQLIRAEIDARMRTVDPTYKGVSWKDAMSEASRLKGLGDPRYQYEKKPKATATPKQAFAPLPLPTGIAPVAPATGQSITSFPTFQATPAPVKKLVRKPAEVPSIPAPASISIPAPEVFTMAPMIEAIAESHEDLVLQEETINGITYVMSPANECWLMEADGTQGAWAGVYNGTSIDDSIPEPSY